jgi:hypothetical protein
MESQDHMKRWANGNDAQGTQKGQLFKKRCQPQQKCNRSVRKAGECSTNLKENFHWVVQNG